MTEPASTKICRLCGKDKPLNEMNTTTNSVGKTYYRHRCNQCLTEARIARLGRQGMRDQWNTWAKANRKDPANRHKIIWLDSRKSDRKKSLENDLTKSFIADIIAPGCSYCGETQILMTLDRKDNTQGHLQSNVQASCVRCNLTRGDMPYGAWLLVAEGMKKARETGLFGTWINKAIGRAANIGESRSS